VNWLNTGHSTGTAEGRVHRVNQEKTIARLSERIDRIELKLHN
jgi:hypothetical protein